MTICYPDTTDWSCFGDDTEISRIDPNLKARAEALAWYSLASLCAWRIGVCPDEVRPFAARCAPRGSWTAAPVSSSNIATAALPLRTIGGIWTPYVTGGAWVNGCGCTGPDSCGCDTLPAVILPGPVGDIEWVKLDGVTLEPTQYRVDNGNRLVSLDPTVVWPGCQDLTAGPDELGSFVVRYYRGAAPNEMTNYAAGVLANEFLQACQKKKCRLPRGVTSVVRQGVTIELRQDIWEGGLTSIPEVDTVINIYNPHHLKQAPRVLTPESRRRARQTTWSHG